jgi:toxin ParE1/3/4
VKSRKVIFAPEARDDLLAIYDWIATAASPAVALSYAERLEAWCLDFDLASKRGHARDDVKFGLRIAGFERRIVVAFTVEDDRITFLRFFHGGRDWERAFP